jgi:osmotically-inducible protein OsmY
MTKLTILAAALAAATLATVGCEQRSGDTAGRSVGQAAKMQAQPGQAADSSQAGDKMAAATDKMAKAADDSAITAKVKAAILAEPGLKSLEINVDTKNATVTLSGTVDSDMLRDRAKQIAMATEGVRNVVDNLNVKTS